MPMPAMASRTVCGRRKRSASGTSRLTTSQHHGDREQGVDRIGHLANLLRLQPVSEPCRPDGPRLITSTMAKLAVFIHGMWGTPDVWRNWRPFLEARGWQTMAPALRHHDAPPHAPPRALGTTSLLDYVADLEANLRALPEKPVVIGHSMGGLIALLLCAGASRGPACCSRPRRRPA